jgi:hypothetical protein
MTTLTLNEKLRALRDTVGVPTSDNWRLLEDNPVKNKQIVDQLNAALLETLEYCKNKEGKTNKMIGQHLQARILPIAQAHPHADIFSSEASITIALFFAANYSPSIYDYLRHRWIE